MKLKITISEEEIKAIVVDHLLISMGIVVKPDDLQFGGTYNHSLVLGNYYGFEYPQKPVEKAEEYHIRPPATKDEAVPTEAPF